MSNEDEVDTAESSSLGDLRPGRRSFIDDLIRYTFLAFVIAVVVLGLTGRFGPRAATVSAEGPRLAMEVRYDSVARVGLGATWSVEITSRDGEPLPDRLELETSSEYLGLFDEHGLSPEPVEESTTAETTTWTFEPAPDSTNFVVELDARVQPAWRAPVTGETTLHVDGEEPLRVEYQTWPLP